MMIKFGGWKGRAYGQEQLTLTAFGKSMWKPTEESDYMQTQKEADTETGRQTRDTHRERTRQKLTNERGRERMRETEKEREN